jgi:hypothetical protein
MQHAPPRQPFGAGHVAEKPVQWTAPVQFSGSAAKQIVDVGA